MVDDAPVIADTVCALLHISGFDAAAVYSGTAAVERSKRFHPDLIVSDIIMPDVDGIDIALRIRSFLPNCKFLFFSGEGGRADILAKAAREFGADVRVLTKPAHSDGLVARISNQFDQANRIGQNRN